MPTTRNSNLPSRTGDPAGAAVGVAGWVGLADGAVYERLEVLLEFDVELELLSSLLPHFPMAKRTTTAATMINATFPPLELFAGAGA
jgi:hypothetical protein